MSQDLIDKLPAVLKKIYKEPTPKAPIDYCGVMINWSNIEDLFFALMLNMSGIVTKHYLTVVIFTGTYEKDLKLSLFKLVKGSIPKSKTQNEYETGYEEVINFNTADVVLELKRKISILMERDYRNCMIDELRSDEHFEEQLIVCIMKAAKKAFPLSTIGGEYYGETGEDHLNRQAWLWG